MGNIVKCGRLRKKRIATDDSGTNDVAKRKLFQYDYFGRSADQAFACNVGQKGH
jgi:hypothetical protein